MSPLRSFTGMGVVLAMAAAPIAAQAQATSSTDSRISSRWSNDGLATLFQQCSQGSGCVLPLKTPPPPPPAPTPTPPPPPPAPAPVVEEAGGFNFLPILLGLAGIAAAVFVIADDDDDDDEVVSP